uniref:Uncharacterized protein n=1 Tax=Aotus nancymaae TaxID=37293 RepID=A0A2K5CLW5_AOTNA
MSRSQFGQGQKPLDTFFWVNELSGEITYPLAPGAPCSPQGLPEQRPAPAPPPKASLKDSGARNPTHLRRPGARPKPEE